MSCRIQRAWKNYQNGRVKAHSQDNNAMLNDSKVLSVKHLKQFNAGGHNTASSHSMHKHSNSQLHVDCSLARSNTVESLDPQPTTIQQAAMPAEASTDYPSYKQVLNLSREVPQYREGSANTELEQLSKGKLKSMSFHRMKHFDLENTLKSGTNYPLSTPLKSLDDKGLAVSKEEINSLDDRYHLCYTIELSDSSGDGDKNWPAGPEDINFTDTAMDNLAVEGFNNAHCGRL